MNGRLAAQTLSPNLDTSVYQCKTDAYTVATVNIVNKNWTPVQARIAVTTLLNSPANTEYVEYDVEIPGKGHLERTGVSISTTEFLTVRVNDNNCNVVVWGSEVGESVNGSTLSTPSIPTNTVSETAYGSYNNTVQLFSDIITDDTPVEVVSGTVPTGMSVSNRGLLTGTASDGFSATPITYTFTCSLGAPVNEYKTVELDLFWPDGTSSGEAAPNAKYIVDNHGTTTDGTYWIDLPNSGPTQVYCRMDTAYNGGGWMLAGKGTRNNSDWEYASSWWEDNLTHNASATQNNNDGSAKGAVFNEYLASDIAAVFPDVGSGGTWGNQGIGWTWHFNDWWQDQVPPKSATGTTGWLPEPQTLNAFFKKGVTITKYADDYSGWNGWSGGPHSDSTAYHWHGFNFASGWDGQESQNTRAKVRWGYAWNNEDEVNSNDVFGGIGMAYPGYSAGDAIFCCQGYTGVNRDMRFEMYVR